VGVPAQCRMPPRAVGTRAQLRRAQTYPSPGEDVRSPVPTGQRRKRVQRPQWRNTRCRVPRPAGPNSLSLGSLPVCAHARAWARACACVCMRSLDKRTEGNERACRTRHCPWHLRGRRGAEAAAPSRRALGSQRNEATSSYIESHALSRAEQSGRMAGWSLARGGGRRVVYVHARDCVWVGME
jgi:hypothetical protein